MAEWEVVSFDPRVDVSSDSYVHVSRLPAVDGWLYRIQRGGNAESITFVPDAAEVNMGALVSVGEVAAFTKASNGVTTVLDAAADFDRVVEILVNVDEEFADDGGDSQTLFEIGEEDTSDKFAATSAFTDAVASAVGARLLFTGVLAATKALIVTATAAEGAATGGLTVTVIASRKAS